MTNLTNITEAVTCVTRSPNGIHFFITIAVSVIIIVILLILMGIVRFKSINEIKEKLKNEN